MSVEIEKENFNSNALKNTRRNIPIKLHKPARISTTCSCIECDSAGCFETRFNIDGKSCSCQHCQYSDSCLFYPPNEVLPSKAEEENDPELNKNLVRYKNEVIKEVTKEHTDHKFSWTKTSKSDVNKEYKFKYKSFSQTKNKIESKRNEYYEKDVTRVHSVTVNYSRKDHHNSAAQLSAQVMNVPYQEFRHSVSFNEPRRKSSPISIITQQKRDIFSRIKEIYKACSCKVCECIAGKSLMPRNDTCKCEPCDCKDCSNLTAKLSQSFEKQYSRDCYSNIRCNSNNCNAVTRDVEKFQSCDCKPCDCVKCVENITKPCDCEACQCVECGFPLTGSMIRRTVVVAPVEENIQHNVCQCEPCECLNCTHNYGAMSSSIMRETSTGISTYRNCHCETCLSEACQVDNTSCRCENSKRIMKKPMEKDIHDYDIHEALIINKSPFITTRSQIDRQKHIAKIASPSANYSATVFTKSQCKCLDCECIICKDNDKQKEKENFKSISQSHKHQSKLQDVNVLSSKACKCLPCECQVCMEDKPSEIEVKYSAQSVRNCKCDICDCINCCNLSYCLNNTTINQSQIHSKPIKSYCIQDKCLCNPCECTDCKTLRAERQFSNKNSIDILQENLYPLKKGKLLTPSMFEANIVGLSNKSNQDHIQKSEENVVSNEFSPESIHLPHKNLIYNRTFPYNFSHAALKKSVSFKEKRDSSSKENKESPSTGTTNESHWTNCKNKYNCDVFHAEINIIKSKPSLKTEVVAPPSENIKTKEQNVCQKSKSSSVCQTSKYKSFRNSKPENENFATEKGSLNIIYNNNGTISSHSHLKKSSIILSDTSHNSKKDKDVNFKTKSNENLRMNNTIKRVKKTLDNAEAYTQHLLKILESSERANKNFVSSTQKYKNYETSNLLECFNDGILVRKSDESFKDSNNRPSVNYNSSPHRSLNPMSSVKFVNCINTNVDIFTPKHEGLFYENISTDKEVSQNNEDIILNCDIEKKDCAVTRIKNTQEPEIFKRLNRNVSKASESSTGSKSCGGIHYKDKVTDGPKEQSCLKISNNTVRKHSVDTENIALTKDFNNITYVDKNNFSKNCFENQCHETQNNRDVHVGFNIGKKNLYINAKPMMPANVLTYHAIESDVKATIQRISNQIKDSCKDNGHLTNYNEIIVLKKLQRGVSDLLNSCILRSANEKTELAQPRHRQAKTKLDLELKYTRIDASSQTFPKTLKVEKEVNCNRVMSMEELYSQMQSCLDAIVSRAVYKSELTSPKHKTSDVRRRKTRVDIIKSSCESLKARFNVVTRISDHTVLVRWTVPQALKEVEGYELQVDGRAVKKIFGPSKCMAVVTCLPHSDRVLLTIRTLTSSQLQFGRQPATTIIYRPRNK